ncbi:hypothetical protein ACEQPO_08000 [Bacillus sp. SL00103]
MNESKVDSIYSLDEDEELDKRPAGSREKTENLDVGSYYMAWRMKK